jgi:hypothetical protein
MLCRKFCAVIGLTMFVLNSIHASETNNTAISETNSVASLWVPGNANPWLAGMPDGSIAGNKFDVAPDQSPIKVTGISMTAGAILTFSVVGGASNDPGWPLKGADGIDTYVVSRIPGSENGIGDITAPMDALVGVFLDDSAPNNFPPPATLDFSTASNRDFASLYPNLRQPFFIGDGKDTTGGVQQFVVPAGATRLFLGTMDSYGWANNIGSFTVKITILPKSP